jgi:alginate O-acetyltransferase complex protein AlgJ
MATADHSPLTREAIALVEVGHTEVRPLTARVLVIGFLLLIAAVPVLELSATTAGANAWQYLRDLVPAARAEAAALSGAGAWRQLVAGNRAVLAGLHTFEEALEDESHIGRVLRPKTQLWMGRATGAGNDRVYLGRDGWLFYQADVEHVTGAGFLDPSAERRRAASAQEWTAIPQTDPVRAIATFKSQLDARGIVLVVMPTPVKPSVHPEKLSSRYGGAARVVSNGSYGRFIDELRARGVLLFDPAEAIAAELRASGSAQYLATDTHWRPEVMEMVAERLAEFLHSHVALPPGNTAYGTEAIDVTAAGDLEAMLDLPDDQTWLRPDTVTVRRVLDASGAPWRASRDSDVLLLGDSFTNIYSLASMQWGDAGGFAEHLSRALHRPIDRIVQNDAGAYATREMLHQAPDRLAGKRVVIYQFATRELSFGNWKVLTPPAHLR